MIGKSKIESKSTISLSGNWNIVNFMVRDERFLWEQGQKK
jgi:hypothetical protein